MLGWTTVWSKRIFFSQKPPCLLISLFLCCFIITKVSTCYRHCCEHIKYSCRCWVLQEIANQLYCCLSRRKTKSIFTSPTSHRDLLAFQQLLFKFCFGVLLLPSISLPSSGADLSFPNQLCRYDLGVRPYLVTLNSHDLTLHGKLCLMMTVN